MEDEKQKLAKALHVGVEEIWVSNNDKEAIKKD